MIGLSQKTKKLAKTFNTYFESVTDPLDLFEWNGESVNSNDKIATKYA